MSGLFYRDKVETIVINLDLEPEERWKDVTVKLKPQVIDKCINNCFFRSTVPVRMTRMMVQYHGHAIYIYIPHSHH